MALIAQIATLCVILGVANANIFMNRRHYRGPYDHDMKDFQQFLADMFHPPQGILQIKPINHPGILGFGSFGGPGLGDYSDTMIRPDQVGYGLDDSVPVRSSSIEKGEGMAPGPVYNFGESELKYPDESKTLQNEPDYNIEEREHNKNPNNKLPMIKEVEEAGVKKENVRKSDESSETEKVSNAHKNESEDDSISKHRDKDAIIFPDKVNQAKDKIAKESNYYTNPQSNNEYASPGPQIVYAVSLPSSGSQSNQAPFVSNPPSSVTQNQQPDTIQNYPASSGQTPQPQYQANGNIPIGNGDINNGQKYPGYTLVTIPSNENNVNSNNPAYVTGNVVSYPPQQVTYQPVNSPQQYYLVSINGQNMLVPVTSVQTIPNQINGNKQINLVPINQGTYLPNNGQVVYGSSNNQNSIPLQTNGQVQYIAVQLAPQNYPQNNNQINYVPVNQGMVQKSGQNTAQGQVNYLPVNGQTTNPSYNQVSYTNNPQQNNPQDGNQVTFVPVGSQAIIQGTPNSPTNVGQFSYVPINNQNPQTTSQYNLVPLNSLNNGPNNVVTLTPASLITGGNVPLVVFKEKAEVTKKENKHKKNNK